MFIDYKFSGWCRVRGVREEDLETLLEQIKKEGAMSALATYADELEYENLTETEFFISPLENGGLATLEIYSDDEELLWSNTIPPITSYENE